MTRITSLIGTVGFAVLSATACSDDGDVVPPWPASSGGSRSGSVGSAGSAGTAGGATASSGAGATAGGGANSGSSVSSGAAGPVGSTGGEVPDSGALVDAGDAGLPIRCETTAACNDSNACTSEACVNDSCVFTPVAIGTPCGDTTTMNECTAPDSCDGNGVCLTNHQPVGTSCEDGRCSLTGVCDCAVDRVTALPYSQQWQTTGNSEVDVFNPNCQTCDNTLDHVVVFTAPATGTYRLTATSGGNVELAVLRGDCLGTLANPVCGENIDDDDEDFNDQLDLEIAQGATVTIVLGEQCEENGGEGTLTIELAPAD